MEYALTPTVIRMYLFTKTVTQSFRNMQDLIHLRTGRVDNKIYDVEGGTESIDLSIDNFTTTNGLERNALSSLSVDQVVAAPNPFSNELNLKFSLEQEEDVILKILDQNGLLLFERKYSMPQGTVSLSVDQINDLPNGYYTYQIIHPGKVLSGKVLKLVH